MALPANSCSVGLSDSDWAGVPDEDDEPSSPPPQPAMAIAAAQAARNGRRLIDPRYGVTYRPPVLRRHPGVTSAIATTRQA